MAASVHQCPRPNENPVSGTCVHVAKEGRTIPCEHCAQYDQSLPEALHRACEDLGRKRGGRQSEVRAHMQRVERLARYVQLAYKRGVAMDAMTKVTVLKAMTSADEVCSWLAQREDDASEDELKNGTVIRTLVASNDPLVILEKLSLAVERKLSIFKRDVPLIRTFLRAARQHEECRADIAHVLKRLVFYDDLTPSQAQLALRFALEPAATDDFEEMVAALHSRGAFEQLQPPALLDATLQMLGMRLIDDDTRHGVLDMLRRIRCNNSTDFREQDSNSV
mgnify:CR=1 FL=1